MEYVQGAPLTDWCDAHRLGIPERLGLFLQVLEAVQYAHEKKVIHRDLKPSNILVTGSGQVRLPDFGVARLLEAEETDQPALTCLAPDLAQAHLALGGVSEINLDFTQANDEYERALALAPGNAEVLRTSGRFAANMGHFDTGLEAAR